MRCFSQGVWTQKANLPSIERYDAMSFSIGANGYIIGGFDGTTIFFKDVWEYNSANNTWLQKQDFATTRWMGKTFSIGTNGYLLTGAPGFYNDFWELNPVTDVWSQKASLPASGRYAAFGFSIGTKGYIGTGVDSSNILLDDFWEYDTTSNFWTQKTNVPMGKRSFTVGFSIGEKGYIGTGVDSSNSLLEDFWEYNPALDSWVQKANYPGGKRKDIDGAFFTIDNYGYMGTGWYQPSSTYYNDFWKYNPSNDTWKQIPNFPATARMGMSGFSLNGKGYIGLGVVINSVAFNDLWEYSPDSLKDGTRELISERNIILFQNSPNPFGYGTIIKYFVPDNTNAQIIFYDEFGRKLKEFKVEEKGMGQVNISAINLASGVYSYSLIVNEKVVDTKKMMKVK